MIPTPPRSFLFVPGNRPERFDKALASGAGAVIIDLEDAVPAAAKDGAREQTAAWLSRQSSGAARPMLLIRINGAGTEWFENDLLLGSNSAISGIVVPKAEDVLELESVARSIAPRGSVYPLIETARGVAKLREVAAAPHIAQLVFGSIDLQLDLGMDAAEEEMVYFRSIIVLASRLAGLRAPIDGVTVAVDDTERLRADILRAKRLGFAGKLCIHPKQVAPVNELFVASAEEMAWARRVLDAAAAAHGAAVLVDGKMVDRPVIARAEAILRTEN